MTYQATIQRRFTASGRLPERLEYAYLSRVAELLHSYGTPAHRLERLLQRAADGLRVEASFLSTPTSLLASFGQGADEQTRLLRIDPGEVDLGKLIEFDEVMEEVEDGKLALPDALERFEAIASAGPRHPRWLAAAASGVASAGAARLFAGGLAEVLLAGALGMGVFLLGRLLERRTRGEGVFEPLAAFVGALAALLVARLVEVDHRIATLAGLIILVPGLTLTVSMIELATRHLVSGVARLAGAGTTFLTILLGVALAWRLCGGDVPPAVATPLPAWTVWLALLSAPPAFAILFEARAREFGVILATGVAGFVATRVGAATLGPDLAAFLGALVIGLASNLYARLADRPASVPLMPGILLLVPGSLGYRSLTSFLEREALAGMDWAFQTGLVAVSLVGGLLAANVLLPPRRTL